MARGISPQSKQTNQTSGAGATAGVSRNAGATPARTPNAAGGNSAIEMLKQDHRKVEGLFRQFGQSSDDELKQRLVAQICEELILHMRLEEEIFYPACRMAGVEDSTMDEAQVEHDGAKTFLNDLLGGRAGSRFWEAKVCVLKEMIEHHVADEEKPGEGAFAQAAAHGIDDAGLATQLRNHKEKLQGRAAGKQPIRAVSFSEEEGMPRYGYPERDDRGRFMSDEDRRYGRSSYRDDDDRYGNGSRRGRGGWFGDSEGHSEAARERWTEGRYSDSRYGGRYEDDERYGDSERYGRDDDYDRRFDRERDDRGRFVSDDDDDDRRYSSRSRDDDDRYSSGRGRGGWFGDSEGHS